jgi:hypothetical protein
MRFRIRIEIWVGLVGGLVTLAPSPAPAAASLEVQQGGGMVVVRWPVEAGYYVLEEAAALAEPIQWAQSAASPIQQDADWVVTVLPAERSRFFRLRQVVATASFRIERHTPLDGATEVGVSYRPQIFFSQPVNPATLTTNNFYASFGGQPMPANIVPANDGSFAWLFFKQPMPSGARVRLIVDGSSINAAQGGDALDADGDGVPGGVLEFEFTTVSLAPLVGTSLSGIVVDPGPDFIPRTDDDLRAGPDGKLGTADDVFLLPVAGVKVYLLGRENEVVRTGADGRFHFDAVPVGDVKVVIDGMTVTNRPPGMYFPEIVIVMDEPKTNRQGLT